MNRELMHTHLLEDCYTTKVVPIFTRLGVLDSKRTKETYNEKIGTSLLLSAKTHAIDYEQFLNYTKHKHIQRTKESNDSSSETKDASLEQT